MITPSFALTATERVLPKLALDFTTASLDPRITFTRSGSTATKVNASGYIELVAADTARFDYDPLTLACKGLLIEEARTNLLLNSQDISSTWALDSATASGTATTSPANDNTGNKLEETATTAQHRVFQNVTLAVSTTYTFSFYAKKAERSRIWVSPSNGANWTLTSLVEFDLDTGTVVSGTAGIVDAGNGWYRCSFLRTTKAAGVATGGLNIAISDPNIANPPNTNYTGVAGYGVYLWGIQMEVGAFATSYIPTEASQVTRTADVATMTGTNFSDWWNVSEAASVIKALPSTISGTRPAIQFDDNTTNESITLRGVAADPQLFVVDGGATQVTLDAGTIAVNTPYILGGAWKASSFATAINGASAVSQASGTLPTVTQARLGSDGVNFLNGHLQNFRSWPQRIINPEVQAFSKG
jgi:hypothetical protein